MKKDMQTDHPVTFLLKPKLSKTGISYYSHMCVLASCQPSLAKKKSDFEIARSQVAWVTEKKAAWVWSMASTISIWLNEG